MDNLYPELIEHIAATVAATLVDRGVEVVTARAAGQECAEAVSRDFGGQQIYVPMGKFLKLSQRDREIYARWNGRNDVALCREHGISERHLRRIIEAMRETDRRERQGSLL